MSTVRFSKQNTIDSLYERAERLAEHHKLDMGNGYAQLVKGADIASPDWWDKVDAYFNARIYCNLADDIKYGTFPYKKDADK